MELIRVVDVQKTYKNGVVALQIIKSILKIRGKTYECETRQIE